MNDRPADNARPRVGARFWLLVVLLALLLTAGGALAGQDAGEGRARAAKHVARGDIHLAHGRIDLAFARYEKALAADATNASAHVKLAALLADPLFTPPTRIGDPTLVALAHLEKALAITESAEALVIQAKLFNRLDRAKQAYAAAERAEALAPDNREAAYAFADAAERLADESPDTDAAAPYVKAAKQAYARLMTLDPTDATPKILNFRLVSRYGTREALVDPDLLDPLLAPSVPESFRVEALWTGIQACVTLGDVAGAAELLAQLAGPNRPLSINLIASAAAKAVAGVLPQRVFTKFFALAGERSSAAPDKTIAALERLDASRGLKTEAAHAEIAFLLAVTRQEQGDAKGAFADYERAKLDPKLKAMRAWRTGSAQAALDAGHVPVAAARYRALADAEPDIERHAVLAEDLPLVAQGEIALGAVTGYLRATQLQVNQPDRARAALEAALTLTPKYWRANRLLADFAFNQREYEKALSHYTLAAKARPKDEGSRRGHALALFFAGGPTRVGEALAALEALARDFPPGRAYEPWLRLCRDIVAKRVRYAAFVAYYQAVTTDSPRERRAELARALAVQPTLVEALLARGRDALSAAQLAAAARGSAGAAEAHRLLASATSDFKKAVANARTPSQSGAALATLGTIALMQSDLTAADAAFAKALEHDPDLVDARRQRVAIARAREQWALAHTEQGILVRCAPRDPGFRVLESYRSRIGDELKVLPSATKSAALLPAFPAKGAVLSYRLETELAGWGRREARASVRVLADCTVIERPAEGLATLAVRFVSAEGSPGYQDWRDLALSVTLSTRLGQLSVTGLGPRADQAVNHPLTALFLSPLVEAWAFALGEATTPVGSVWSRANVPGLLRGEATPLEFSWLKTASSAIARVERRTRPTKRAAVRDPTIPQKGVAASLTYDLATRRTTEVKLVLEVTVPERAPDGDVVDARLNSKLTLLGVRTP